jgi:VanZ family protein
MSRYVGKNVNFDPPSRLPDTSRPSPLAVVVPAALWAAFIFAMSTQAFSRRNSEAFVARLNAATGLNLPRLSLLSALTLVRSSAHFVEFFVLVWLLHRALTKLTALSPLSSVACAVASASGYGLLDEVHQRFVPGRSASPVDWGIDVMASALAGMLIVRRAKIAVSRPLTLPRQSA